MENPGPSKKVNSQLHNLITQQTKYFLLLNLKVKFFKRCPGARPGLTCCNYFVLNLGVQCNMNCSYCYLQSFVNTPVMKVYANIERARSPSLLDIGRDLKRSIFTRRYW